MVGYNGLGYECDANCHGLAPALGDAGGRWVVLDGEDDVTGKLFGNGFQKGFLMRAGEGLPEDDAINFQGLSPDGSCIRAK